jgi:hypothetical protein
MENLSMLTRHWSRAQAMGAAALSMHATTAYNPVLCKNTRVL